MITLTADAGPAVVPLVYPSNDHTISNVIVQYTPFEILMKANDQKTIHSVY